MLEIVNISYVITAMLIAFPHLMWIIILVSHKSDYYADGTFWFLILLTMYSFISSEVLTFRVLIDTTNWILICSIVIVWNIFFAYMIRK